MSTSKRSSSGSKSETLQKNKLEWTVFAISLALLIGLLSYLVYQSVTRQKSTPDLKVSYTRDPQTHNPHRLRIILENTGGETAEDIWIEAGLIKTGQLIERSSLQIAFSPKRSKREGWVNFSIDPSSADSVAVKVMSYKKP